MDSKIFELALQWQGMHNYLFTNYKKRKRKKKKRDNQLEKKRLET